MESEESKKQKLLQELKDKYDGVGPSRLVRKLDMLIEAHRTYESEFKGDRQPIFLMTKEERENKILLGHHYDGDTLNINIGKDFRKVEAKMSESQDTFTRELKRWQK